MADDDSTEKTQDTRHMAMDTAVGKDKVFPLKMEGTETLGRLFEYEIHAFSEGGKAIQAKDLLGTNASVRLKFGDKERYFNGFITRFTMESVNKNRSKVIYTYRLTMTPALWRLTRSATCRIFQQKTVKEIVTGILQDASVDFDDSNVTGDYRTWDYCVQYRETDFNFISRLLENEGIYYYFKHNDDGTHTVMLCDSPTAHEKAPGYETLEFKEPDVGSDIDASVWNWEHESQQLSNTYELMDYNHETPTTDLFSTASAVNTESTSILGLYDYPGAYTVASEGTAYAKVRMQEIEAQYQVADAETSARGVYTGCIFTLDNHPGVPCVDYLVTSSTITISNDDFGTRLGDSDQEGYYSEITVVPSKVQYRSPRLTPKPLIQGPQTAVIEGAPGDEICTDEFGRAKVHFYWDKATGQNDKSSCWIRVSQNWAGKHWGAIFLPRVGQEVIVEFLEGDPDRPIITGRVYNQENGTPYELPGNKTISTIKSNSSVGGGGFNEFRFEDKIGEEKIFIHAEHNMDIRVNNDRFENVGKDGVGNRHLTVEKNAYYHIKNDQHWTVDMNYCEKIGQDFNLQIGGKEAKKVTGTQSLEVTGDVAEVFHGKHSETTDGNYTLKADNIILEGKTSVTIKVGSDSVYIEAGKIHINGTTDVLIDGGTQTKITALSGASTVKLDANIEEDSTSHKITSSGGVTVSGGPSVAITAGSISLN